MGKDERKVSFLSDLGRANMRGLRKCKKCGTLNGTRGFACKNASCDVVFKEDMSNKKCGYSDVIKLDSGSCRQIYSVRIRDKGPDYRGFVELPSEIDTDLLLPNRPTPAMIHNDGTICYVEMCVKNTKYSTGGKAICKHAWSAQQCCKEAKTLVLWNSSSQMIQIPSSMRNELWLLATDSPGPLVQRVSKAVMAVKCKADSLHPLGFLHLSFHQFKNRKDTVPKFFCGCRSFKEGISHRFTQLKNCIHFYACIMAFASSENLSEEFSYFINLGKSINNNFTPQKTSMPLVRTLNLDESCKEQVSEVDINEAEESSSFLVLNDNGPQTACQVQVEVLQDISDDPLAVPMAVASNEDMDTKLEIQLQSDDSLHLQQSSCGRVSVHQLPTSIHISNLKRKEEDSILSKDLINVFPSKRFKELRKRILVGNQKETDEELASFNFVSWLSSVAERINQTMQYGFSGKPDPLVFHIPRIFFNCILDRINKYACGKRKKCSVEKTSITITDAVPNGTFTKLTWKLTNLMHVVNVFSSNERTLKISRHFAADKNGRYRHCEPPVTPKLTVGMTQGPAVRPHELKTVLNVGIVNPVISKEPVPFVIEWIANIIPECEIGELRLKFEFIHYNNDHFVPRPGTSSAMVKQNRQILPLAPKLPLNKVALPVNTTAEIVGLPVSHDFSPGDIAILTF